MDFAGHPTLGTCHAWLAHGGQPQVPSRIVQECGAGLVTIAHTNHGLAFAAPAMQQHPLPHTLPLIYDALGLSAGQVADAALLDVGTPWLCLRLHAAQALMALRPSATRVQSLTALFEADIGLGVCALTPASAPADCAAPVAHLEVRAFTLDGAEDPVTGSLNACLAQWLIPQGLLTPPYQARQGRSMGRDGWIGIHQDAQQQLWVQGHSVRCITGQVLL